MKYGTENLTHKVYDARRPQIFLFLCALEKLAALTPSDWSTCSPLNRERTYQWMLKNDWISTHSGLY